MAPIDPKWAHLLAMPPNEIMPSICNVIGQLVIYWSLLEYNLDAITNIVFINAEGGQVLRQKRMPRQLTEKTIFIRRAIAEVPSMRPFPEAEPLLNDIERDADIRNAVVHGYLGGWDEKTFEMHFIKLKAGKSDHTEDRQIFRYEDIMAAGARSLDLAARTYSLANKLMKAFMIYDERDKPF